ncbi:unnamed protein product [[Candida] boidinii]|nr:unnamed protein product [[Candida] boidinii]
MQDLLTCDLSETPLNDMVLPTYLRNLIDLNKLKNSIKSSIRPTINNNLNNKNDKCELINDLVLQIIEIKDVTKSNINLIERYEEAKDINNGFHDRQKKSGGAGGGANNNTNKTRQRVIRSVANDNDNTDNNNNNNNNNNGGDNDLDSNGGGIINFNKSIFKLLLQDNNKDLIYAIEIEGLKFLRSNEPFEILNYNQIWKIKLGSKLLIKKSTFLINNVLLLNNLNCYLLNGEIKEFNNNLLNKELVNLKKNLNNLNNNNTFV